ncbi:MAG: alkaline phosphatase family protein [Chloroflexi bacterium]|nr:alkaline phosphatase family protein [Chloroflexota bacterium]
MRTLLLGLDAFDPVLFERLYERGEMPHLGKYVQRGGYARLGVTNPPQSEVSWTSMATGQNPGGHGLFDFVHRDPASYTPFVSLLPTAAGWRGPTFTQPSHTPTIFDFAASRGFPATALWWPAHFPARPQEPIDTLPGLGTPDVFGRLGVGTLFSSSLATADTTAGKIPLRPLASTGRGRFAGVLHGPAAKGVELSFAVELLADGMVQVQIGTHQMRLAVGQWSEVLPLTLRGGWFGRLQVVTRLIVTRTAPDVAVYLLPLQMHPLAAPWHYAASRPFVRRTWQAAGPFLTLGWPQDTTAVEEGHLSRAHFLALCDLIEEERERVLLYHLGRFGEGLLGCVLDTLDRVQHLFWRDDQPVVAAWYRRLDGLVGKVEQVLANQTSKYPTQLVVASDHGFTSFDYKIHLNRWLIQEGYLRPQTAAPAGQLTQVQWADSRAYAVGLNSIYLNQAGREGQGIVGAGERLALQEEIRHKLLGWRGPDGRAVVQAVWRQEEAFEGPLASYGPDVVVGFAPGYRASAETGLGEWRAESVVENRDEWGADHCVAAEAVPGVLFHSGGLGRTPHPSYRDMPALTVGADLAPPTHLPPPPTAVAEDPQTVEERLRSLGYL